VDALAQAAHTTHNIILVERNSHFQHLFAFPRISVVPGFEQKAFIPYKNAFPDASAGSTSILQATVERITRDKLSLDNGHTLPYEYLVLATGIGLGAPGDFVSGNKAAGVKYFQKYQGLVKNANHITVVGGGAYGVRESIFMALFNSIFLNLSVSLRQRLRPISRHTTRERSLLPLCIRETTL
jgi:apoptosis-inducing factor 2